MRTIAVVLGLTVCSTFFSCFAVAKGTTEKVAVFKAAEANQGVAVDANHFYAVDNQAIGKYDKKTGEFVAKWVGPKDGPIIHLDSGFVLDGKLYCAHSNYSQTPMTSSVEIWDTKTMKHIGTYSFGIRWGSFTWLDRYNGYWWGGFANYDKKVGIGGTPYGNKYNTTMVQFDDSWQPRQAWILPNSILSKFEDMSNSGGSWGPDDRLYLSGHDPAEIYAMTLPEAGSILVLDEIIPLQIKGQGIAWDRTSPGMIYGINRPTKEVIVSRYTEVK